MVKNPDANHKVGSFWWKDCCSLISDFKEMTTIQIYRGNTAKFWEDVWNQEKLKLKYPQLYSFAKNKDITVQDAKEECNTDFYGMFHLPMSSVAVLQSQELFQTLNNTVTSQQHDHWKFLWNSTKYSTRRSTSTYWVILPRPVPLSSGSRNLHVFLNINSS